ncbi:MAG: ATP-binding protein, partial [Acidimicrobiales bacterium]
GEPGIGKTRLAAQLAMDATDPAPTVLFGRCDEHLSVSYQPFVEALTPYLLSCPAEVFAAAGERHALEVTRLIPELAARLTGSPAAGDFVQLDVERYTLFEAISALLAAGSRAAPLLLVLDDLHWAAPPTLMLLRHLLRAEYRLRLLVVGTYRSTELGRGHPLADLLAELRSDDRTERLSLVGLAPDDVEALVAAAGHDLRAGGADLARALHHETGGNPFFLAELLHHLDGRDLDDVGLGPVPHGVRDVVGRRLARLPELAAETMTVAAVCGSPFDPAVVRDVVGRTDDEVLDALDEARQAGLLVDHLDGYAFPHGLIQDAVLADLSVTRRVRLHRRIGEAIESLPGAADHVEALAHHFGQAAVDGQAAKAARYALAAGRRALDRLAYEEAIAHAERGLESLEVGPGDPRLRCDLLLLTGWALLHLGSDAERARATGLQASREALAAGLVDRMVESADVVHQGTTVGDTSDEIENLFADAVERFAARSASERAAVLAKLALFRAARTGSEEALAQEAVMLARQAGDEAALLASLHALCFSQLGSPDIAGRQVLVEELVAVSSLVAGRRFSFEWAYPAAVLLAAADFDGFGAHADRLDELAARTAWWEPRYLAQAFRAIVLLARGQVGEASTLLDSVQDGSAHHPDAANVYASFQFLVQRELGHAGAFVPLLEVVAGENPGLTAFRAGLALARAEAGDVEGAHAGLREIVGGLAGLPRDQIWPVVLGLLAETAARLEDAEAAAALRPLLEPYAGQLLAGGSGTVCFGTADRHRGMLAAATGDPEAAESCYADALGLEERLGAEAWRARTLGWWARTASGGRAAAMRAEATEVAARLGLPGVLLRQ